MKAKNKRHKIGLYIRVSTQEQAQNPEGSIKNQRDRLEQAVKLKNMERAFGEVSGIYIDAGKSGKDTNRPELQRLLQDIMDGKIDLVMASELSRISRSIKDFSEIWDLMQTNNCSFLSLRESFDTTTAAGEMVLYTIANIAQFERRQVSERITANMLARAKRGLYNGGPIPYGLKQDPTKTGYLIVDPEQAEIVKMVFKTFLKERTLSKAGKWLNDNGYKLSTLMRGGGGKARLKHFTTDNVHHILRNKAYIGVRIYIENDKECEAEAVWDAIIDKDLFNQVQKILGKNKSRRKPDTWRKFPYLFSGLVTCAHCGDSMVGKTAHGRNGPVGYYEHSWKFRKNHCLKKAKFECGGKKRVGSKKLEPVVLEMIENLMDRPEVSRELFKKLNEKIKSDPNKKKRDRLKQKVKTIDSKLDALTMRLAELPSNLSGASIYKQMDRLEKEKRETEDKLRELKQENKGNAEKPATLKDYRSFLQTMKVIFGKEMDHKVKAKVIQRIVSKIEIGADFVKVHYFVGQNSIKKGESSDSDGSPLFLCQNFGSNTLTNGGR